MNCPTCGAELEPYATFCSSCGNYALPLKNPKLEEPAPEVNPEISAEHIPTTPRKVPKRLYPPENEPAFPDTPPDPEENTPKKPDRPSRKIVILAVVFGIIALTSVVGLALTYLHFSGMQVQMRKAQMEKDAALADIDVLTEEISSLEADLATAREEKNALATQINDLVSQVSSMETSVNQSQYDKESAERELDEAKAETESLTTSVAELQAGLDEVNAALEEAALEKEALEAEVADLEASNDAMEEEIAFYDAHVVFVMTGSSDHKYHNYNCSSFKKTSFLAYSTKLAEANGYEPCPICIGSSD